MSQSANELIQQRFEDWSMHPGTVALRRLLRAELSNLKDRWASGGFTADTVEASALLSANAVGQCEIIQVLLDLTPEQLFQEQDE